METPRFTSRRPADSAPPVFSILTPDDFVKCSTERAELEVSNQRFQCDQCMRSFSKSWMLERHKNIHLPEKPYQCLCCSKRFSRKDHLERHRVRKGHKGNGASKEYTDITTEDYNITLDKCTDNQLSQLYSILNNLAHSPFPTTSLEDEPPPQDNIQLSERIIKSEPLEDSVKTFTQSFSPTCNLQQTLPVSLTLSDDPEHGDFSKTCDSDGSSAATERHIDERKSHIVNSIVFNFTQWIRSTFSECRKNGENNVGDASETSEVLCDFHPETTQSNDTRPDKGKRKLTERDDGATDDEGEDGHGGDQQTNERPVQRDGNRKYACPYFKYNSAKYQDWRICPGPGWTDVHRVKEHLYRRHRQPKYRCGRCWEHFKDEQGYLNHQRTREPCPLREMEHVEGFDAAQEKSLKSRKRTNPELSETEKWKRVYQILFPHVPDDDIPSPSVYEYNQISRKEGNHQDSGSDVLAQCEEYMVREVPQRLRQALARELDRDLNIVEESLRRKAGDWVKTLLEEAFRELRHDRHPDGPSQALASNHERSGLTEESCLPSIPIPQPHNTESDIPNFEGDNEAFPVYFDMNSFDPFYILGETELSFDNGGLLENLLQPEQGEDSDSKKHSDSGYRSSSST